MPQVFPMRWRVMSEQASEPVVPAPLPASQSPPPAAPREQPTREGDGLDPTRYGDWEKNGRCIDF